MDEDDVVSWVEWDCLASPCFVGVRDPGSLPQAVETIVVSRTDDYKIACEINGPLAVAEEIDKPRMPPLRAGELIPPAKPVRGALLTGPGGSATPTDVEITGLHANRWTRHLDAGPGSDRTVAEGVASGVVVKYGGENAAFMTDWLVNVDACGLMFPSVTRRRSVRKFYRERDGLPELELDVRSERRFSHDHVVLNLSLPSGVDLSCRFGQAGQTAPQSMKPGFLEFELKGQHNPSQDERDALVACLSFVFGRQIYRLGSTVFSEGQKRVSAAAFPCRLVGGMRALELQSWLPVPVSFRDHPSMDADLVSRLVNLLLPLVAKYRLDHSLWINWIGSMAPADVAAVHFGAALESFRDAVQSEGDNKLLSDRDWNQVRPALLTALDGEQARALSAADGESAGAVTWGFEKLRNKLQQLNERSSAMKYTEFFSERGLRVGDVERVALATRNLPAHGHRFEEPDYQKLILNVRALRTLLHRSILAVAGFDRYMDYSTLGFPVREIAEPMGGPEGDGRAAR